MRENECAIILIEDEKWFRTQLLSTLHTIQPTTIRMHVTFTYGTWRMSVAVAAATVKALAGTVIYIHSHGRIK